MKIVKIKVTNAMNGRWTTALALLDSGATFNFMDIDIATELDLLGYKRKSNTVGFGGSLIQDDCWLTKVVISPAPDSPAADHGFGESCEIEVHKKCLVTTKSINWNRVKAEHEHLREIPFNKIPDNHPVRVILGVETSAFHRVHEQREGMVPKAPIAERGPFGWLAFGRVTLPKYYNRWRKIAPPSLDQHCQIVEGLLTGSDSTQLDNLSAVASSLQTVQAVDHYTDDWFNFERAASGANDVDTYEPLDDTTEPHPSSTLI